MFYEWFYADRFAGYVGETDADSRKVRWYDSLIGDPLPPIDAWSTPRLVQYLGQQGRRTRKPKPIGDSPSVGLVRLLSERACHELSELLAGNVKLYPVALADAEIIYYMVVVTNHLDCLDEEKSSGKKHVVGPHAGRLAVVEKWVFEPSCVGSCDIFALPYNPTTVYVSDRFLKKVVEAKLTGFCFKREFWEEAPFVS